MPNNHERQQEAIRRNAMLWMLRCAGVPVLDIAKAFGISTQNAARRIAKYEHVLLTRSWELSEVPFAQREPWMKRLGNAVP